MNRSSGTNSSANRYLYLLIIIAAAARILPHPANFAPIGALALFSGAHVRGKSGFAVPIVALLIGDALIGFYSPLVMAAVYVGFAASAGIGALLLRHKRTLTRYIAAVLASTLFFYFISNLAVWYTAYPHTTAGFLACYVNALPYLLRSLAGNVVYSLLLFGTYEYCVQTFLPQRAGVSPNR